MTGWTEWEVDSNTHYQADTFRVQFAISALPPNYGTAWWSSQSKLEVEIFAGFPSDAASFTSAELKSMFFGRVDDLDPLDLGSGVIGISGRDLTADLIDTKTSEKYANLTSSQIVRRVAAAHGMTPIVTSTSTKVGRYYTIDKVRLQDDRTEWDLLTWLAREEQFDTFVRGKELHFQPKASTSNPRVFQCQIGSGPPSFDGTRIVLHRSLTLAKDITVEVKSWNTKQKKGFTKTAKSTHTKSRVLKGASSPVYDVQTYSRVIPNLQPDEAQSRANQILSELSKHEMKVDISGPADNDLDPTQAISVAGSGTAFDQVYYPDSIIRRMSAEGDGGYTWSITAKNHPVESEPGL